jgi:hypothetical protein
MDKTTAEEKYKKVIKICTTVAGIWSDSKNYSKTDIKCSIFETDHANDYTGWGILNRSLE